MVDVAAGSQAPEPTHTPEKDAQDQFDAASAEAAAVEPEAVEPAGEAEPEPTADQIETAMTVEEKRALLRRALGNPDGTPNEALEKLLTSHEDDVYAWHDPQHDEADPYAWHDPHPQHMLDDIEMVDCADKEVYRLKLKNGGWIVLFEKPKVTWALKHAADTTDHVFDVARQYQSAAGWHSMPNGAVFPEGVTEPNFAGLRHINDNMKARMVPPELNPDEALEPNGQSQSSRQSLKASLAGAAHVAGNIGRVAAPVVTGMVVGGGVRIAAQFLLAKAVVCLPLAACTIPALFPVAAAIVTAVGLGALSGAVSKLVVTQIWGGDKKNDPHWRRKALVQGALWGAGGGLLGFGIADYLNAHGLIQGMLHGHAPVPPGGHAPDVGGGHGGSPTAPNAGGAHPPVTGAPAPSIPTPPPIIGHDSIHGLISPGQLKTLSPAIQKLLASQDPHDIIRGCKEASFHLINHASGSADAVKAAHHAGAELIQRGLDLAQQNNITGHVVQQLHADEAYTKAWGLFGESKSLQAAFVHAKQAGVAMHGFGDRLMSFFGHGAHAASAHVDASTPPSAPTPADAVRPQGPTSGNPFKMKLERT